MHSDLLTGRVWLVPTFKTATLATASRNFVFSVFRDMGLQLVSARDTRFTSALWTDLHTALDASLVFSGWSPQRHNTTSKVERVSSVITDVLRSFASERCDDWPELVPLVDFAIKDSASTLGSGYTPFYADRC